MSVRKAVIATTHLDRHGDKLTVSALRSMAQQAKEAFIPVRDEHDPRNPPIGRVINATVKRTPDGEFALVCDVEYFDQSGDTPPTSDKRKLRLRKYSEDNLQVSWDRSYRFDDDQKLLRELATTAKTPMTLMEYGKKALDPVSILQITGAFVLGGIATGLLNKVGSDSWDSFKRLLEKIVRKKVQQESEAILAFSFSIEHAGRLYNVSLLVTNPQKVDIEAILELHLPKLDSLVKACIDSNDEVREIVLEYRGRDIRIKYAVTESGEPVFPGPRKTE